MPSCGEGLQWFDEGSFYTSGKCCTYLQIQSSWAGTLGGARLRLLNLLATATMVPNVAGVVK